jgi:dipeptidase
MPPEIGLVMWWCINTPKTGAYIPWYFGTMRFPSEYTTGNEEFPLDSAYWTFFELKMLAHHYCNLAFPMIQEVWSRFEAEISASRTRTESEALRIFKSSGREEASQLLTTRSNDIARETLVQTRQLIADIKTKAWFME